MGIKLILLVIIGICLAGCKYPTCCRTFDSGKVVVITNSVKSGGDLYSTEVVPLGCDCSGLGLNVYSVESYVKGDSVYCDEGKITGKY